VSLIGNPGRRCHLRKVSAAAPWHAARCSSPARHCSGCRPAQVDLAALAAAAVRLPGAVGGWGAGVRTALAPFEYAPRLLRVRWPARDSYRWCWPRGRYCYTWSRARHGSDLRKVSTTAPCTARSNNSLIRLCWSTPSSLSVCAVEAAVAVRLPGAVGGVLRRAPAVFEYALGCSRYQSPARDMYTCQPSPGVVIGGRRARTESDPSQCPGDRLPPTLRQIASVGGHGDHL